MTFGKPPIGHCQKYRRKRSQMEKHRIFEGTKFVAEKESETALDALHEVMVECAERKENREYRLFRVEDSDVRARDVYDTFGYTGYECLCEIVIDGEDAGQYDFFSQASSANNAEVLEGAYGVFDDTVEEAKKLAENEAKDAVEITVFLWESYSVDDDTDYTLVERYEVR